MERDDPRATLKALEADYNRYREPEVIQNLKASVLDKVWDIYSGQVITMDRAPFVLGRIFQAMDPYSEVVIKIKQYEEALTKLARLDEAAQAAKAQSGV